MDGTVLIVNAGTCACGRETNLYLFDRCGDDGAYRCPRCLGPEEIKVIRKRYEIYNRLVDWRKIDNMSDEVAKDITDSGKRYDGIFGIPRSGSVVAVKLSNLLGIPCRDAPNSGKSILVVDDVTNTGKTLEGYAGAFDTAVLFKKPWSPAEPTYWADETQDRIIFPWELPEQPPGRL